MYVSLTDVLTKEGKTVTVQAELEADQAVIGGEVFPVTDKSPFELTFANIGKGRARMSGSMEITFAMSCNRCLKPVDKTLCLRFDQEVFAPDVVMDIPDAEDEQGFMDGYQMDVEDFLSNEIVINWPMKVLCKPDCLGICRQCGTDLNTGTCGCDTFVPDPRMAAIKDIFNGNKEV